MGECDWAYDCSPLHTACVTLIRREHKAIIIMASSLRRRGVLARHQEDLLRSKKLGAIYIRPDTTPNPYIHQSIFTPRHVSFNTSSSLLLTQMVDKEYQVEKNSRLSKEERQILGIQNKYSVRPRTAELYKDADRRRRELKRRQRQPPPGHQSKPTIYAGRRPQSADGKETMKAAIRHYGLALKHLVAGSGPTSAKASDFEVSGNTSTSEEDEDTREINKVVVTLHLNRALCLLKLHEWNDAIQECDAALDLDPASVKAYYRKISAQVGMMQQELDNEMRGAMWDIEKAWFISEIAVRDIKLAQSQQCMTSQSESNALAMKTVVKKVQRIRKYLKKHRVSFLDRVESAGSTAGGSE